MAEQAVRKRPDAWRATCDCGHAGEWRDRKWMADADAAGHAVQAHGGTPRLGDQADG